MRRKVEEKAVSRKSEGGTVFFVLFFFDKTWYDDFAHTGRIAVARSAERSGGLHACSFWMEDNIYEYGCETEKKERI